MSIVPPWAMFQTHAGTPASEGTAPFTIARGFVHAVAQVDSASGDTFMQVRFAPSATSYAGDLVWVRQYGPRAVGDEVYIANTGATVGERDGLAVAWVECGAREEFIAWPTAAGIVVVENKWQYTIAEVAKTGAGFAGWSVVTNGRTGTAYNMREYANATTGTLGNGVPIALLGGLTLQPIPPGFPLHILYAWRPPTAPGTVEYWFDSPNGLAGECFA